jgi:hypothetical protein
VHVILSFFCFPVSGHGVASSASSERARND